MPLKQIYRLNYMNKTTQRYSFKCYIQQLLYNVLFKCKKETENVFLRLHLLSLSPSLSHFPFFSSPLLSLCCVPHFRGFSGAEVALGYVEVSALLCLSLQFTNSMCVCVCARVLVGGFDVCVGLCVCLSLQFTNFTANYPTKATGREEQRRRRETRVERGGICGRSSPEGGWRCWHS